MCALGDHRPDAIFQEMEVTAGQSCALLFLPTINERNQYLAEQDSFASGAMGVYKTCTSYALHH